MQVSKKRIIDGVSKFISDTLIPEINDGQTRFVLSMIKDTMKKRPDMIDSFLDNPIISSSIIEDEGMYEVGHFVDTMRNILEDCECYPITIPKIPLLSPMEKVIKIKAGDFEKLVNAIWIDEEETSTTSDEA